MSNMCISGVIVGVCNGLFATCEVTMFVLSHKPACIIAQTIGNANSLVSMTSIAAMALDRLIAITLHMKYHMLATPRNCAIFIVIQVG